MYNIKLISIINVIAIYR